MNNWGLHRFAGKPYCLTGVVVCFGGWLEEWILPMCGKITYAVAISSKNSDYPKTPSKLLKQRNPPARVEGANAPQLFIFHYSFFIN